MEKTVELKIHKQLIEGTTPAVCWFTIGEDAYCQQADFLLGDLIDIMRRIKNREPLDSIRSGNYQQSTLALFRYLYNPEMLEYSGDGMNCAAIRKADNNEVYCADVLQLFDTFQKIDWFSFSQKSFRAFKDYSDIRIPDCSVFYYPLKEGLGSDRVMGVNYLEDYIIASMSNGMERHCTYQCHTIRDAILSLLEYLAEEGYQLAVCRRCGRLYSPVNLASEKYCRRLYGDKECRKLAVNASIKWHLESDQILREYQRKLTSFGSRIKGGYSSSEWCKEQKQILMDEYHQRRARMEAGEITEEELLNWLKSFETKAPRKNGSKK